MTLPHDITRCMDSKCPERDTCDRAVYDKDQVYWFVLTLRKDGPCDYYIPIPTTKKDKGV